MMPQLTTYKIFFKVVIKGGWGKTKIGPYAKVPLHFFTLAKRSVLVRTSFFSNLSRE